MAKRMPDRILTPHRSAYVMIFLALGVIGLATWNIDLTRRQGTDENLRRAQERDADARAKLGCVIFETFEDVAVEIPIANLDAILAGHLTVQEREQRVAARERYLDAREKLMPTIQECRR